MIDNKDIKLVRNLDFDYVRCSQFKEFNYEQLTPIQARLYYLMVEGKQPRGDSESLYGWSEKIGLPKSTTYGIFTKGNQNMHKGLASKLSEATGADPEWIRSGIGEPFAQQASAVVDVQEPKQDVMLEAELLDTALLEQAFETLVQALEATDKVMQPSGTSRFVSAVYASLKENEEMDTEVLQDCILTVEEALKATRRVMSPKAKTRLIQVIYEIYSGNASYKEAMTHHIDQLIRSVS